MVGEAMVLTLAGRFTIQRPRRLNSSSVFKFLLEVIVSSLFLVLESEEVSEGRCWVGCLRNPIESIN